MNLSSLRATVYDLCGKPTRDEMDDFLVDGWLLSDLAHYNSRLSTVGKPHLGKTVEVTVTDRRGIIDQDDVSLDFTEARFVRLLVDRETDTWEQVGIAGNVSHIQEAQRRGERLILFYEYPDVKYYLSWKPVNLAGDILEMWFDRDVTDISASTDSPGMPPRFHDLPALRTVKLHALPHLLRPQNAGRWRDFVMAVRGGVADDLMEREQDFEWWLLGSPEADEQNQIGAFDPQLADATWRI